MKPDKDGKWRAAGHLFLVLVDCALTAAFLIFEILYISSNKFQSLNDKVLHAIIGAGFGLLALTYSYFDGVRFLRSNIDRLLYLLSCLIQKPILLPLIMPCRFKSRKATKAFSEHRIVATNGKIPTKF